MSKKTNIEHLLTNKPRLSYSKSIKIIDVQIHSHGAKTLAPQQVSQALASQVAVSQLDAALRRLFPGVGKGLASVDLRRIAVKFRREVCRTISKAIRKMDPLGEPRFGLVVHYCSLDVPVHEGTVRLVVCFAFLVSVGFVHMVEPVVRHQFG